MIFRNCRQLLAQALSSACFCLWLSMASLTSSYSTSLRQVQLPEVEASIADSRIARAIRSTLALRTAVTGTDRRWSLAAAGAAFAPAVLAGTIEFDGFVHGMTPFWMVEK